MSTHRKHYPAFSALVLLSTLSLGIRTILAYCLIRHFGLKSFISMAVSSVKMWEFCNAENLQGCVIFWLFSGIYFKTEQYNLKAFIIFWKDVLTNFNVAL